MSEAVLITGGARRIGRVLSHSLAAHGFDIALHYNSSENEAREVAEEVKKIGSKCGIFQCDFSNVEDVNTLMERVFSRFPACTILINNASIFERSSFMETDPALFDRHFRINFRTPFFLSREFARHCSKGQIINIVDTKVTQAFTPYFAYTLSKKAFLDFTFMAAKELAPGIRVNAVAPGNILPPPDKDHEYLNRLSSKVPLKTSGEPAMIAEAVLFLVKHSYITGQCIYVDGGEHIH